MAQPLPHVEIHHARTAPQRPPWVLVTVDLTLHNPTSRDRWFILPRLVAASPPTTRSVSGAHAYALPGEGVGWIVRLDGAAGWRAIAVAAGGGVRIEALPIDWWCPGGADDLTLEGLVATDLTLDDQPLGAWLGVSLDPTGSASVTFDLDRAQYLGGRDTDDFSELPLAVTDGVPFALRLETLDS